VRFEWDPAKAAANLAKHGVAFDLVAELDWSVAVYVSQLVQGEPRIKAHVPFGKRLHICVYVQRGEVRRVVSLRKANRRAAHAYLRMIEGD
jgi:hypothetical protein